MQYLCRFCAFCAVAVGVAVFLHTLVILLRLWVCLLWLAEWLLALGFSRFARWMARRGGGEKWASFALLPAYESAMVFKKVGVVSLALGTL